MLPSSSQARDPRNFYLKKIYTCVGVYVAPYAVKEMSVFFWQ